jgi:hypothetical protein
MCLRWMSLLFTSEVNCDEDLYDLRRLILIIWSFGLQIMRSILTTLDGTYQYYLFYDNQHHK